MGTFTRCPRLPVIASKPKLLLDNDKPVSVARNVTSSCCVFPGSMVNVVGATVTFTPRGAVTVNQYVSFDIPTFVTFLGTVRLPIKCPTVIEAAFRSEGSPRVFGHLPPVTVTFSGVILGTEHKKFT